MALNPAAPSQVPLSLSTVLFLGVVAISPFVATGNVRFAQAAPVAAALHHSMHAAAVPLASLRSSAGLDTATVRGRGGELLGFVHDVAYDADGRPQSLRIAFGGIDGVNAGLARLNAATARFDARHNAVLIQLNMHDLTAMSRTGD